MAFLFFHHITLTARNLFMLAPYKHVGHWTFWQEWLLWKFVIESGQFVIHHLSFS